MEIHASVDRINKNIEDLSSFNSEPHNPGITRQLFTDAELAARKYIKSQMMTAGLLVSEDGIGNIYGTLEGENSALAPVWSGSHIDTVKNGGKYDGTVGVIGAREACRLIRENHISHKRNIVVVVFTSEEHGRFGLGCIGSRAMAGHLSLDSTSEMLDDNGVSLYQELNRLGYSKYNFEKSVNKKLGDVYACVELHIEQYSLLERMGLSVGIVEAICAPTYFHVSIKGRQEHAGSTPMSMRCDALSAASQIILELENLARSYGNGHTVATVGKLQVFPNSSNVIPGTVEFDIDIRDSDEAIKKELMKKICLYIDCIAMLRNVNAKYKVISDDIPKKCNPEIINTISKECDKRDIPIFKMTSGAYHDSLFVAEFAPVGMIFVPSRNGISHNPEEFTAPEDIRLGVEVLTGTLIDLANNTDEITSLGKE